MFTIIPCPDWHWISSHLKCRSWLCRIILHRIRRTDCRWSNSWERNIISLSVCIVRFILILKQSCCFNIREIFKFLIEAFLLVLHILKALRILFRPKAEHTVNSLGWVVDQIGLRCSYSRFFIKFEFFKSFKINQLSFWGILNCTKLLIVAPIAAVVTRWCGLLGDLLQVRCAICLFHIILL